MTSVLTFGESMALMTPPRVGLLRHASTLGLGIAGAESNVAIGLARLGCAVTWVGRVGDDEFGRLIETTLRGQGVTTRAISDVDAPTGLMVKEHRMSRATRVIYYRANSAGSRIRPSDITDSEIEAAGIVHATGITAAISASGCETVARTLARARAAGALASFDLNHRSALWSAEQAASVYREFIPMSDIVFATEEEARMVVGPVIEAEALAWGLHALGPATAIVKRGSRGAVAVVEGRVVHVPPVVVPVVDPVGAGDAFTAGYLAGLTEGRSAEDSLRLAGLTGAFAVTVDGDWEGSPSPDELDLLFGADGDVIR